MIIWKRGLRPLAVFVPLLLAGCGAGTAGIVAGSSGSSGGATPALDAFVVESPKESPSLLKLDASQPVRVGLFYDLGAGEQAMTRLLGIAGNEVDLPAGELPLRWDFAAEPGIGTPGFTSGVRLLAKRGSTVLSGGELTLGLGNDAPVVLSIDQIDIDPDAGEASGTTGIQLTVADSSDDVVSVKVEFDIQGDDPDAGWQLARPALADPDLPTPLFGLTGVQVQSTGTPLTFFWDTDALTDLKDLERDVRLRFTATDGFLTGAPLASPAFRVDNNAPPIVQLDSGPLILNPDERRGIPIPFRVIDEEGDRVEVIFQWRREGEEFPELPRDKAQLDAILADPELRREHRICTEYPRYAQGRVIPIDATTVRLPELASSESWILAGGLEGKTLELLRPSSIPQPITPTWSSNPLVSPIAALPVGDGLTALVLDVPGNGRLREIELATGAVVREIATIGPGIPSAMAFERREKAVLVALDDAGTWRIVRVEVTSGVLTELIVSDGSEPAPVRGIASLGTNAAVFTAGSSLFHLDYRDLLAPQLGKLLVGLATPSGVVVDPLSSDRIYLAERDANRVLAAELDSHAKLPIVVNSAAMQPGALDAPGALALERHGSRMLIVTSAAGSGGQLLGLDLGASGGSRAFPIGPALPLDISSVAAETSELRLLCASASNELLVAGGIEQRRSISSYLASTQEVSLESTLDPISEPGRSWRIPARSSPLRASAIGTAGSFLWDSTEAPGVVFTRAIARDEELGSTANGAAAKRVRAGLDVDPLVVVGTLTPSAVAAADLDGDGDPDLVFANSVNLTVVFQQSPGRFSDPPLALGGSGVTNVPRSVAAADLDGDGDLDLVSANELSENLTVFFQLSPGTFSTSPLVLGGPGVTSRPRSVVAADLDGDDDLDLVSANTDPSHNLTVFFQLSPGNFSAFPLELGSPGVKAEPRSVAAADLDGDGDVDLVSANYNASSLSVFFQLSPGVFSHSPIVLGGFGVTNSPVSVAAADLDGDGDFDLVSANDLGNDLTVFFQLSPGIFSAAPLALGGLGVTSRPSSLAAADLDGDGNLDLVSTSFSASNVTVFFQLSPGSFSASPLTLGGPGLTNGVFSVAAADLDGDGDNDLVSANLSGSNATVFFQLSPGSFGLPLALGGFGVTSAPVAVTAADLDRDGDMDLVSANHNGGNLTVFLQLSPGSFSAFPFVLGGSGQLPNETPFSVAAADLDRDGDLDLVSTIRDNLTVFFQLSPGTFSTSPLVLGGPGITNGVTSVAAADFDRDGDLDLVSANGLGDNLSVFLQLSPGSFAYALTLSAPGMMRGPRSVATADLDGDGDQDIVSANQGSHNLTVFLQLLPGNFSSSPLVLNVPGVSAPSSVAAADVDADGALDLVSANLSSSCVTVFFQLSPGTFEDPPLVLGGPGVTTGAFAVAAADLDGDGDLDLVSVNNLGNNLTVFFQLSPRIFSASPLVLGGPGVTTGAFAVAVSDLDGDSDFDVVSANSNNLTVFFGAR